MSLTWQQVHGAVRGGVKDMKEAGIADSTIAEGVRCLAQGRPMPTDLEPWRSQVHRLGWLLLGRVRSLDPSMGVTLQTALTMVERGHSPLDEVLELARVAEEKDQEKAAELPAQDRATWFFNRAVSFAEGRDLLSAVADCSSAIQADPKDHQAYMNRGTWLLQLQDLNSAMQDWQTAVEIKPDYALGWMKVGLLFVNLKRMDEAFAAFRRSLAVAPPDWEHRQSVLDMLEELGAPPE